MMRRIHRLALVAMLTGALPAYSQATPTAPAIDQLVAVADADPMELARVAQRLGDRAVLDRLDAKLATEVRLAAIRATPQLREPENALGPLCLIISIRDTVLAQAAARSVLAIVGALDADQLQRHEVSPAELAPVRKELERVATVTRIRADLRAMATAAAAMLAGLGVASGD